MFIIMRIKVNANKDSKKILITNKNNNKTLIKES